MMAGMRGNITDRSWVREAFMVPDATMADADARRRTFSSVAYKFTDTRLGGNFCINNPPQYTEYADLIGNGHQFRTTGWNAQGGMGRFYSEQVDDNSQIIHMRFGVPQFNGMFTFFTGFYDGDAGYLARTGRAPGVFYNLGKLAGFVVQLPFAHYIAIGYALRWFAQAPASKYYYLKETMSAYWSRVNMIVNDLAVNMKLVPPVHSSDNNFTLKEGEDVQFSEEDIRAFHQIMPGIFKEEGGIDVYNVANRAQRLAHERDERMQRYIEDADDVDEMLANMDKYRTEISSIGGSNSRWQVVERESGAQAGGFGKGIEALIQRKHDMEGAAGYPEGNSYGDTGLDGLPTGEDGEGVDLNKLTETSWRGSYKNEDGQTVAERAEDKSGWDVFWDNAQADLHDGSQFVSFRVDHTGEVSESFSNSTKESDIASKLNGFSSSARNARFSFSDGQTGFGVVDGIINSVRDFAGGIADSLQISGLVGLLGNAFVDIPEQWDSSSAEFPTSDYTIQLRSPYGNDMSRLINLYIPLSMLLAAALPISTGKQSHTSPFLCELYDRGRNQIRLGMIDSLSITRGVGNMGWTPEGKPLGIDVTFSVKDLSTVMHAPITTHASLLNPVANIMDDDSAFKDYLATLSSLTMGEQIYSFKKFWLNLTKYSMRIDDYWSVSNFTNWAMDTGPARLMSGIAVAGARGAGG